MKPKITIFTISVLDNDYLKSAGVKMCIQSWKGLIKVFENLGYQAEIKIYDYRDQVVSYYRDKFQSKCVGIESHRYIPILADFIRLDILSKNNNFLYLDGDVYFDYDAYIKYGEFIKDFSTSYIGDYFGVLWSGVNNNCFKKLLELENKENKNLLLFDRAVLSKFPKDYLERNSKLNYFFKKFFYHFGGLDRSNILIYQLGSRVNETIKYAGDWGTIPIFTERKFLSKENDSLSLNEKPIYFLDLFPLSEMSKAAKNDIKSTFKIFNLTNKKFLKLRLFLIKHLYKKPNIA